MLSIRRGSFVCVADTRSYALLDIDRLLKIPLFPICSLDGLQTRSIGGHIENKSGHADNGNSRSASLAHEQKPGTMDDRGHGRITSLGTSISSGSRKYGPRSTSGDRSGGDGPEGLPTKASPSLGVKSPQREPSSIANKPIPPPPEQPSSVTTHATTYLKPHIVSPNSQEFLLITGTGQRDPGVGVFVNLEGDVTRSTLDFHYYPDDIVVDGRGIDFDPTPTMLESEEEGFVLASMTRGSDEHFHCGIEIQRWDLDPRESATQKFWLETPFGSDDCRVISKIGLRSVVDQADIYFQEVVDKLRLQRFQPFAPRSMDASKLSLPGDNPRMATSFERVSEERELFESGESLSEGREDQRNNEELEFAKRMGSSRTRIVAWSRKDIWWTVRTPLLLQLDASIPDMNRNNIQADQIYPALDRMKLVKVINSSRRREAKTEIEFLSLAYFRQRAGLLLFMSGLDALAAPLSESECRIAEDALLEGGLDPRVILAIVPCLRNEIVDGQTGIWIYGGVKDVADNFVTNSISEMSAAAEDRGIPDHILHFLKRFLTAWRKKKGFGSVSSEREVFRSVDAALLIVLLQLDKSFSSGHPGRKPIRLELYEMIDSGVDCFDRAVSLLESHRRLYVLSRLYQSRKLFGEVLATWRRILEGEVDEAGEFRDGEQTIRKYLVKVQSPALVEEYGVWLATRNPKLGVQVFAEDRSLVKFKPSKVFQILRDSAPGAIKDYLEYLVFSKNYVEYVNELVTYYLDIITNILEESSEARVMLRQTYESYQALRPPKPTYQQFITENTVDNEWWHSRLRLLKLLEGIQGSASPYDIAAILKQIAPYARELIPEVIILNSRQSHHEEALRLLIHGLGDYDTALNYCLLSGSSIYHPISDIVARERLPTRKKQEKLFGVLLEEFLQIEDISNRVEQTVNLLERFGDWLDIGHVLSIIPDTWSVDLVSGFLVGALRRIVEERSETVVAKALSGAENLKVIADLIGKVDSTGPSIEASSER